MKNLWIPLALILGLLPATVPGATTQTGVVDQQMVLDPGMGVGFETESFGGMGASPYGMIGWQMSGNVESDFLDDIRVSLQIRDVSLVTFLNQVFEEHDIQYIIPSGLDNSGSAFSARFDEMPLSDALDAVLGLFGLTYSIVGENVVLVAPVERMVLWQDARQVEFETQQRDMQRAVEEAAQSTRVELERVQQALIDANQRREVLVRSGQLPEGQLGDEVMALQRTQAELLQSLQSVREMNSPPMFAGEDWDNITQVIEVSHRDPLEVRNNLNVLVDHQLGESIVADRHHLIITARPSKIEVIERVLREIDTP